MDCYVVCGCLWRADKGYEKKYVLVNMYIQEAIDVYDGIT